MLKNNHKSNKLLVIVGPTASGKSDLAISLAKKFNGEVVSADSRQVYRGMNIGTGKVSKDQDVQTNSRFQIPNSRFYYSEGIRHHLLDVADPKKDNFSVVQYQKLALKAIKDIQKRGKLPILCGGTGLYISSVIEGWIFPKGKPNLKLRKKLEKESAEKLFKKLQKLDPERAKTIDPFNKRRLIRALEILIENKKILPLKKKPLKMKILILGIKKDKEELKKLIKKRLEKRLKEGMIKEVEKLKKEGVSSSRLESFGLEYRFINRYLENKISFRELKEQLFKAICQYAKRQMTWFRNKIKNIIWIENPKQAIKLTGEFISN